MNTKHLLTASLIGGAISVVLANAPYVNLINILFCAGFWIGPIAAVWFYRQLNGSLTSRDAILISVLAGVWHGVFGLVLSPLGLAGAGSLLNDLRPMMPTQDWAELENNLTGLGGLTFNLFGVAFDIFFGFIGGLLGGAVLHTRREPAKTVQA
jgi:hypothetical protein